MYAFLAGHEMQSHYKTAHTEQCNMTKKDIIKSYDKPALRVDLTFIEHH